MIEHCVAAFNAEQEGKLYRIYITDALKAITENTARFVVQGVGEIMAGVQLSTRWVELNVEPEETPEPEDDRPATEIAADIWARMRGET